MDLAVFSPQQLPVALGAMWNVANANGSITPEETQLFEAIAQIHGAAVPALGPTDLNLIADVVQDPHARHRLTQLAVVAAMVDQDPTPAQSAAVDALADALGQDERGLKLIRDMAEHRRLTVRLDVVRRLLGGRFLGESTLEKLGRFKDLIKAISKMAKFDWDVNYKYRKLGLLPEGTLGREFFKFSVTRGFQFPGDVGGILESAVFHDFGHVLAGYDTTDEGEIRQGSFQAGNRRDDGFVFLCFVLTQKHVGYTVMPNTKTMKGAFNVPAVMEAVARGAACKVDITEHWNFWEYVERPVSELRAEFGIPPIAHLGEGVQPDYRA